ncbi:lasso peptide biosynthesis B2 protein [Paraliobacillus sediminis]|uniref:lasso peptide biosynthesis B2 protein n=1 Tax=Paraliobacillus sediminis TaxID=1885916 RepID=UPI000E3D7EE0|nr:lasso peptide biosynthesis B2 protein [Paraliobacillus sediminis]
MDKLKKVVSLPFDKKRLYIEVFVLLAWARILKALPFGRVAPSLGEKSVETSETIATSPSLISDISKAIALISRYTFWESACLVQAIAAMKMLERRKIESTLYLGTARDKEGKMIAHAWLRSGPFYVTGSSVMHNFTVVSVFGKFIDRGEGRH